MASALLTAPVEPPAPHHCEAVERVIAVMSRRLDERLSLEDLAALAFFSPYHFHRVFRNVTASHWCLKHQPRDVAFAKPRAHARGTVLAEGVAPGEVVGVPPA